MRIVHFSDWHWSTYHVPEADLYVCTGDMYCNYPYMRTSTRKHGDGVLVGRPAHEKRMQTQAAEKFSRLVGMRAFLGSPDAPIICVRGNHDFTDLGLLFAGCNLVHEFVNNEVVEVLGLRVTGHRGIPTINGRWSDECARPDLYDRFQRMDKSCDLYLTHYPPAGVGLDLPGQWGLDGVENWFLYNTTKTHPVHMFGHIHECGGMAHRRGDVWFSNAATGYNTFEGSSDTGWNHVTGGAEG